MKPFIATLHTQAHMLITRQSTRLTKTTGTPTKGTRSTHPLKFVLIPLQEIEIFGFVINTVFMTAELTLDKKESLGNSCKALLSTPVVLIRELAQVIGKIVASFPGVMGPSIIYIWSVIKR